eukprot:2159627-Amphidinium_carterae.2
MSCNTAVMFREALMEGHTTAPPDLRGRGLHPRPQREAADAFLNYIYVTVAENMPTSEADFGKCKNLIKGYKLRTPPTDPSQTDAEHMLIKYLNPGNIRELYSFYENSEAFHDCPCSYKTFMRAYQETWKGCLRFRGRTEHAKCTICQACKKQIRSSKSEADKAAAQSKYIAHIRAILADRLYEARLGLLSQQNEITLLQIDGMDQQKLSMPRWEVTTKSLENGWRPRMSLFTVLSSAVEFYYVKPPTANAGSSMEWTMLLHSLDCLSKRSQLCADLTLKGDNTPKELRNQITAKMCSLLVGLKIFRSVTVCYPQVGHSHSTCDQRFAQVCVKLKNKELHDVSEFITALLTNIKPSPGADMLGFFFNVAFQWAPWTSDNFETELHGLTSTKSNHKVMHKWKFVLRKDYSHECQELFDTTSEDDVVMLSTHHMHEVDWKQAQVVLSASSPILHDFQPVAIDCGKPLTAEAVKEFNKTADKIEASMPRGAAFLREMCKPVEPVPPYDLNSSFMLSYYNNSSTTPIEARTCDHKVLADIRQHFTAVAHGVPPATEQADAAAGTCVEPMAADNAGGEDPMAADNAGEDSMAVDDAGGEEYGDAEGLPKPVVVKLGRGRGKARGRGRGSGQGRPVMKRPAKASTKASTAMKRPASAHLALCEVPGASAADQDVVTYGCSKCRYSKKGCSRCRVGGFMPRPRQNTSM